MKINVNFGKNCNHGRPQGEVGGGGAAGAFPPPPRFLGFDVGIWLFA
jgi:hypothetical protein